MMLALTYLIFWTPLLLSLSLLAAKIVGGPFSLTVFESVLGLSFLRLELTFDTLSTVMLTMIGLLVGVIGQYAFHYLDRQERKVDFFLSFSGLAVSVALMSTTSNIAYILLSWMLTSAFLSHLLLYNRERFQARLAVKKKFWISRIGDLCLLGSIVLLYRVFGTLEFSAISEALASSNGNISASESVAIGLLCLAALVKAVQFPFHIWLPETMETPAPVSAIMHAGVVNAGGFLLIRSSPILEYFPTQLLFVAFAGAISAVFGSLVMLTQNDIKKKLAYSTISQMGIMVFACGIGAFSIAFIHIVAHSLYKAHAFLSTGNLISESQLQPFKSKPWKTGDLVLASVLGLGIVMVGLFAAPPQYFSLFLYAAVITLGLLQCLRASYAGTKLGFRFIATLAVLLSSGFALYLFVEQILVSRSIGFVTLANVAPNALYQYALVGVFLTFLAGFLVSQRLMHGKTQLSRSLYYFLLNGAYLNSASSRLALSPVKGDNNV